MMKNILNLHLFDGEGGNGAAVTSTTSQGEVQGEGREDATPKKKTGKKENPLSNVKYGIQKENNVTGNTQTNGEEKLVPDVPDLDAEFNEMVEKYQDQFNKRVEGIVKERLKNSKATENQLSSANKVLNAVAEKYGVDTSDIDGLLKAIDNDNAYLETEALEKGMTVEQLKRTRMLERNNQLYLQQEQAIREEKERRAKFSGWLDEANAMKDIYPEFDFGKEMSNKDFIRLLESNVPVRTAYEVIHKDDIIKGAVQYTAQQVKSKISQSIQSGKNRPAENGTNSVSTSLTKSDASKLSKADRKEIMRRVERGENIAF